MFCKNVIDNYKKLLLIVTSLFVALFLAVEIWLVMRVICDSHGTMDSYNSSMFHLHHTKHYPVKNSLINTHVSQFALTSTFASIISHV